MTVSHPSSAPRSEPALLAPLDLNLPEINRTLEKKSAPERIEWALATLQSRVVLSSSFGAQAAVSLHLATRIWPEIPVILIDTGYLFPETYRFVDELTDKLRLNLHVYRADKSPAWQEARYGRLWEQGLEGLEKYNQINKVEPMKRALADLGAWGWIAGLRRQQADTRKNLHIVGVQDRRLKIHPILEWTDKDIYLYLQKHDLPYHPLWHQNYVSIGDVHSTRPLLEGMTEQDTRFGGLKRECGLHENTDFAI
jgi:phosphoadenosine phosphosulfate reductase